MKIRMSGEMADRLQRWGVIKPKEEKGVATQDPENRPGPEAEPLNQENMERQLILYGDQIHVITKNLNEILTQKEQFFKNHPETSETHYEDLKTGSKPDFDQDNALVHEDGHSPNELDVFWNEQIEDLTMALEDIKTINETHPELNKLIGANFLAAADAFLKSHQEFPGTNIASQKRIITAIEAINKTIEVIEHK